MRFVAAGILMLITFVVGYGIWHAFFRYQAFGIVVGNIVEVSSAFTAPIRFLHAREGDEIEQGQTLVTLQDLDTEQQLERIYDELRVAQATLHADLARMRWNVDVQKLESDRAVSEYSQTLSVLERESAELLQRSDALQRTEALSNIDAVSDEQVGQVQIAHEGQRLHVEALKRAAEELKQRSDRARQLVQPGDEQIKPAVAKIDSLLNELDRLGERLDRRFVSSPISGTILRRHRSVGEQTRSGESVFSVLESGSVEIQLFVRQSESSDFAPGDELELSVAPHRVPLVCKVMRIGDEMTSPPEAIETMYRARERVVPVFLRPVTSVDGQPSVRAQYYPQVGS
jgi:multidrug resistance efflux pump